MLSWLASGAPSPPSLLPCLFPSGALWYAPNPGTPFLFSVNEGHSGVDSGVGTFKGIWILIREFSKRWKSFEVGKEKLATSGRTHNGLFFSRAKVTPFQCAQLLLGFVWC